MGPRPVVPYKDERTYRTLDEIEAHIPHADRQKRVDLQPYINEGCYTVPDHASLTRVYKLFRGMGLRHLPVVSRTGVAVGMITRADLRLAGEPRMSRDHGGSSHISEPP